MAKNSPRLHTLFALANPCMVRYEWDGSGGRSAYVARERDHANSPLRWESSRTRLTPAPNASHFEQINASARHRVCCADLPQAKRLAGAGLRGDLDVAEVCRCVPQSGRTIEGFWAFALRNAELLLFELTLDDLLAVVRELIEPAMSRSALDRLLRRRGVNRFPEPAVEKTQVKSFKAYEPGYVHMDVKYLPQMDDETGPRYIFVAIDRATRWVFIAVKSKKTVTAARSFLNALRKAAPFKIGTLLTDIGREFTDRAFGRRAKDANGDHEFEALCQALGIEHRLTKPKHPETNGMVERFHGRLPQVLRSHRFNSAHDLETTLHRFVWLYSEHLPPRALDLNTPIQALKKWQATHPDLFAKRVVNHPGPDISVFTQCRAA